MDGVERMVHRITSTVVIAKKKLAEVEQILASQQILLAGSGSTDLQLAKRLVAALEVRLAELQQVPTNQVHQLEQLIARPIVLTVDPFSTLLTSTQEERYTVERCVDTIRGVVRNLKFEQSKRRFTANR